MTTQDLELDQERKDVGMAVDMYFARNAAVFILWEWIKFSPSASGYFDS